MSDFKKYLKHARKEYKFRLKSISPITSEMYTNLCKFLEKYRPNEIGKVYRTIMQANPLDFDVTAAEIYMVDFNLNLPVSSFVLINEVHTLWQVPKSNLVVRNEYEGMEQLTSQIKGKLEMKQVAEEKGLAKGSYLELDGNVEAANTSIPQELIAGQTYVDSFKNQLAKTQASRSVFNHSCDLFKSLEKVKADKPAENFNKDIKDAPVVVNADDVKDVVSDEEKIRKEIVSNWGNVWTTGLTSDVFKDGDDTVIMRDTMNNLLDKYVKKSAKGKK